MSIPEELGWIHDCSLSRITYIGSDPREITIEISCPADLGYPPWEGKTVEVIATGVRASRHTMIGTVGTDMVDAVRPGISSEFENYLAPARKVGWKFPPTAFTVAFTSGSTMELVCEQVTVRT
jgi:hypothetical protein